MAYWTDAGVRCNNCFKLGREWHECAHCQEEKACRERGREWLCQPCTRVADLTAGGVTLTRRVEGGITSLGALAALHLTFVVRVELWSAR